MSDKPRELSGINRGVGGRALATGKIAFSSLRLAARRLVGATGAADGVIGAALAAELDQMKGMAMKVGQILSYFEGTLPAETTLALQSLQRGARPVAFETMAEVVSTAFGQDVDALFEAFEREPVAAASIGQVYRARFAGEPVAVKLQYPGVYATIDADFARLGKIAQLASLAAAVDGPALVSELRARVGEECDYEREAQYQTAFAVAFAGDADVRIPRVFSERTRRTVLTSEWCAGRDFYTFAAQSEQAQRDAAALVLTRFAYRSLFGFGVLNADPHPGNYLFPTDGPIVLLDFGCVRRFDRAYLAGERRLARVLLDDDRRGFDEALLATGMVSKPARFDFDAHWRMLCHLYAPYRSARFTFTTDYIQQMLAFKSASRGNLRLLAIPPEWIWTTRLQWGLHAVLARLSAQGPFRAVLEEALAAGELPFPSID